MVSRMQAVADAVDEAQAEGEESSEGVAIHEVDVSELTARFVSASCEHEPTDEEWRACLLGAGYDEEKVSLILSGGNAEG